MTTLSQAINLLLFGSLSTTLVFAHIHVAQILGHIWLENKASSSYFFNDALRYIKDGYLRTKRSGSKYHHA